MKKLQNWSGFIFIICTAFLAVVAILGIWQILSDDVVIKSEKTIGLLALVAIIVIIAGRFTDSKKQSIVDINGVEHAEVPDINPAFTIIRHGTLVILIAAVTFLALFGVLAIWDVLSGEVLSKSLASIGILAFASLIVVVTCLEREHHKFMERKLSGWMIFLIIIFMWPLLSFLFFRF